MQARASSTTRTLSSPRLSFEQADFYKVAACIGFKPIKARKIAFVAARQAQQVETVVTRWDGQETTNTARRAAWIVTNLSATHAILRDKNGNENTYIIEAETFPNIYAIITGENEFGRFCKAKNLVDAL